MESNVVDRMARYQVKGLFQDGNDHTFELEATQPTILTGGNGSGKSTILRSIDAICTEQWNVLEKMPFAEITLTYESGRSIRVVRTKTVMRVMAKGKPTWEYYGERAIRANLPDSLKSIPPSSRNRIIRAFTAGVDLDELPSHERGRLFELSATVRALGLAEAPDWIHETVTQIPVVFVTDQRLMLESRESRVRQERVSTRTAVDQAVQKVSRLMSDALSEYAATSQRLDRDFAPRVVTAMSQRARISDKRLTAKLLDNEKQANALQRVGLLPEDVSPTEFTDIARDDVKAVIMTHADDTAKKLAVLAPLRERLTLFNEFLSQHYAPKRLHFDRAFGFKVLTSNRELIDPSHLSSGEKQMLVLAYQILFKADPGTLVLIDEPELSLHVLWQDSFIDDISRMGAVRNLSFLLATHSPTLIGGRRELTRSLDVR